MGRPICPAHSRGASGAVKFIPTRLAGVFIIELERLDDERGFFARSFCHDEFARHGLATAFVQCNVSFNRSSGTLRGLHYQASPHAEPKLVRCTRGALYDVVVDIRVKSNTYKEWLAVELSADNYRMIYIPEGCAHGFQTLMDNSEVFYQMAAAYHPDAARGIRYNDAALGIQWPLAYPTLSARDAAYPDFEQ